MTTLLAFLFVLGVLIFVHELGHFLAARRLGVRVLTFSLGFGPKILKTTRGDTEYCISIIPLGGYVKMAGENPEDSRTGSPDEFLSRTKWERFQILIAGAMMNLILAVVVMAIVLAQGAEVPAYQDEPPVVGAVLPDSPFKSAKELIEAARAKPKTLSLGLGAVGAAVAGVGGQAHLFVLFAVGMVLFGGAQAATLQGRYVAADLATDNRRAAAIAGVVRGAQPRSERHRPA